MQVFLGVSKNSMVALSVTCCYMLEMHIFYESACIIGYCNCWVVVELFVCIVALHLCVDFSGVWSLVLIMQIPLPLSHGFIIVDWLFSRLVNAVFSCYVKLL